MAMPPGLAWELLVVDNNSSDGTAAVVSRFGEGAPFPVRYIHEPRGGIAVARNRAAAEARGEVIAFTDDDCIVAADWAARIADEFARDPALVMLGGRVELYDAADAPIGIRTGREPRELSDEMSNFEALIGANMALRLSASRRIGGFDPTFGAGSGIVGSSEDTEFTYRMLKSGGRVAYLPDILVYHHHGRRHGELPRRRFDYTQGRGAIYAKHVLRGDPAAMRMMRWELGKLLRVVCGRRTAAAERREARMAVRALASGVAAFLFGSLRRRLARA
jgi:GT2 family glycosyltransferase